VISYCETQHYIKKTIYGIPFVADLSEADHDDIQLVYRRNCRVGRLTHTFDINRYEILNDPADSDVYIYQKSVNNYTISNSTELDLYNSYYLLSGYRRLKLSFILKQKYRSYKKNKHKLLEVVRFAVYIYYNSIIFRIPVTDCKIHPMVTEPIVNRKYRTDYWRFKTDPNIVNADECRDHYTDIIDTLYPQLKRAITFCHFG
jgi:hypothetical protein